MRQLTRAVARHAGLAGMCARGGRFRSFTVVMRRSILTCASAAACAEKPVLWAVLLLLSGRSAHEVLKAKTLVQLSLDLVDYLFFAGIF